MQHSRQIRRAVLLALSLLSGCAASTLGRPDLSDSGAPSATRLDRPADGTTSAFLIGRLAGQTGDIQVAADQFLRALRAEPNNLELAQQAFLACLLAGRPEAQALARAQPGNPAAALLLGDVAAARGDWAEAEARFSALPNQGVTQVLRPLLIAWAQFGGGRADAALATLRPYTEGEAAGAVYTLHAALISDLSQRDPEAARLYRAAQADFGTPNLLMSQALASWQARQPDGGAEAARTLAAMAAASSDLAIALPDLQRHAADRLARKATDGMALAYLAEASALRSQNAPDYAALLLRFAIDLRPDLTAARLLSAEITDQSKHPESSLAMLQPVADDDPLAAVVQERRAALLAELSRNGDALAVLARLQASHPDRPEPWTLQGAIVRGEKKYAESADAYGQAIARTPAPAAADWVLFYQRGIAFDQARRWPQAEADFKHALALQPEQPNVLNYLAYSWTEQGIELPLARRMIERAVAQRPNDAAMTDSMGWIMLRQGDVTGAVRQLERASELQPEDPTINNHLGDAYRAAGDTLDAQFQWRRALTLNPDQDEAAGIAAKLKQAGGHAPPPIVKSSAQP